MTEHRTLGQRMDDWYGDGENFGKGLLVEVACIFGFSAVIGLIGLWIWAMASLCR